MTVKRNKGDIQMNFTCNVSDLRNELYIHNQETDEMLFSIHGYDIDVNFTKMTNEELKEFIINNYQDVIYDLT